jgi:hypothetical protein
MDLAAWVQEAKAKAKEAFAVAYPHNFLVAYLPRDESEGVPAFRTEIVEDPEYDPTKTILVLPIVRGKDSPYADRISIGRARNCDVVLRHSSVSKLHAQIRLQPDGELELVDCDSRNGTFIEGTRLEAKVPRKLSPGAHVAFGEIVGNVFDAARAHTALVRLG